MAPRETHKLGQYRQHLHPDLRGDISRALEDDGKVVRGDLLLEEEEGAYDVHGRGAEEGRGILQAPAPDVSHDGKLPEELRLHQQHISDALHRRLPQPCLAAQLVLPEEELEEMVNSPGD
eukprot:273305-Hanusia_phi.AAC.1